MNEYKIKKYWNELYILKECDPFDTRTDKEFCLENNISYSYFRNWKSEHRRMVYDEVNRRRGEYTAELRAKARKSLVKKLDSDTNALKLAFQLLGDLVEKQEVKTEHYTQEDIKRRLNDLLQNISNRTETWKASAEVIASDADEPVGKEDGSSKDEVISNGTEAWKDGAGVEAEQPNNQESGNLGHGVSGSEPGENPPMPRKV